MKLDKAQLDDFFLQRVAWVIGTPLPPMTKEVALYHIYPDLGRSRADNILGRGLPGDTGAYDPDQLIHANEAGRIFQKDTEEFIQQDYPSNQDKVISEIILALFREGNAFIYSLEDDGRQNKAIRYFARKAAPKVEALLQSESPDYDNPSARVIRTVDEAPEDRAALTDRADTIWSRPEKVVERIAYANSIKKHLMGDTREESPTLAERWLALDILTSDAGYEWSEIAAAFRCVEELRGEGSAWEDIVAKLRQSSQWSSPGTSRLRPNRRPKQTMLLPGHPCFLWMEISRGYSLPGWFETAEDEKAICLWFPRATSASLRQFYCRGRLRLEATFIL